MKPNNSSVTGKRGEYKVIAKLMESGLSVYIPVVDIEGIDCIIRNDRKRLIEIQIKTRNKAGIEEGRFFGVKGLTPHKNFFICCYYLDTGELWTIPSYKFYQLSYLDNDGKRVLKMSPKNQRLLATYSNNLGIDLLKLKETFEGL